MKQHWILGIAGLATCVAVGCSKKDEAAGGEAKPSAAGSALAAGNAPDRSASGFTPPECKLPEPAATKLPAPDASFTAKIAEIGKCSEDSSEPCAAADDLTAAATKSIPESNEAPLPVVAACVAGLDHASSRVRTAAAECLYELGHSIKDTAPVVRPLLEKFEGEKNKATRLKMSFTIGRLNAAGAGYTCRVVAMIARLPSDESTTSELFNSLHGVGGKTNDAGFDFAYAYVMANRPGVASAGAMSLLTTYAPESRKGELCGKLATIVKAGVNGWGAASSTMWKTEACKEHDVVISNAVAKLGSIGAGATFKEIDRPLTDASFIEDLPTWPGISDAQKKEVCDAAKALAANGKLDDAKSLGTKIATNCAK